MIKQRALKRESCCGERVEAGVTSSRKDLTKSSLSVGSDVLVSQ